MPLSLSYPLRHGSMKEKVAFPRLLSLILALNTGLSNTHLRSPTQGLLEEVGPNERSTGQGRVQP